MPENRIFLKTKKTCFFIICFFSAVFCFDIFCQPYLKPKFWFEVALFVKLNWIESSANWIPAMLYRLGKATKTCQTICIRGRSSSHRYSPAFSSVNSGDALRAWHSIDQSTCSGWSKTSPRSTSSRRMETGLCLSLMPSCKRFPATAL